MTRVYLRTLPILLILYESCLFMDANVGNGSRESGVLILAPWSFRLQVRVDGRAVTIYVRRMSNRTTSFTALYSYVKPTDAQKKRKTRPFYKPAVAIWRRPVNNICSDSLWRRANARNVSFQSLYGDQFTLSTQLINPKFRSIKCSVAKVRFIRLASLRL